MRNTNYSNNSGGSAHRIYGNSNTKAVTKTQSGVLKP